MCLIVERLNKNHKLTKDELADFFNYNPDGFGLVPLDGHLKVIKGQTLSELVKAVKAVRGRPFILHLRMATHGSVNADMSHPFDVLGDGSLLLMHNGVVSCRPLDASKSDTWEFARLLRQVIEPVPAPSRCHLIRSDGFRLLVEGFLGSSNRLVLIDRLGHVVFNQHLWHTMNGGHLDGLRVSNAYAWSYRKPEASPYVGDYTGGEDYYKGACAWHRDDVYATYDDKLSDPFYVEPVPESCGDPSEMTYNQIYEKCVNNPEWAAECIEFAYHC